MKNLLTYVSPEKGFNEEHQKLAQIQIDNSLSLGWRPEDIIMATNFDYEYQGIKATKVADENYCNFRWPATKIYVIVDLFERGLIGDDIYWYHDFDCYQLASFSALEPGLGTADMGLTNYGRMPRLCSASIFFKQFAEDIFRRVKDEVERTGRDEEMAIARLINGDDSLKARVKHLNISYAFHRFNVRHCYHRAIKPLRAAHFHLTSDKYDFYVRGNNKLQMPLIPEGLVEIFHRHGFNQ